MSTIYDLEHVTTYRCRKPVKFGQHRAVFLPRAGHSYRILDYAFRTNIPSKIRWKMDTLSNNVTLIEFDQPAAELTFHNQNPFVLGIGRHLRTAELEGDTNSIARDLMHKDEANFRCLKTDRNTTIRIELKWSRSYTVVAIST